MADHGWCWAYRIAETDLADVVHARMDTYWKSPRHGPTAVQNSFPVGERAFWMTQGIRKPEGVASLPSTGPEISSPKVDKPAPPIRTH